MDYIIITTLMLLQIKMDSCWAEWLSVFHLLLTEVQNLYILQWAVIEDEENSHKEEL